MRARLRGSRHLVFLVPCSHARLSADASANGRGEERRARDEQAQKERGEYDTGTDDAEIGELGGSCREGKRAGRRM